MSPPIIGTPDSLTTVVMASIVSTWMLPRKATTPSLTSLRPWVTAVDGSPWSSAIASLIGWPFRPPQAFCEATNVFSAGTTGENSSPRTPDSVLTFPIDTGVPFAGAHCSLPPKMAFLATRSAILPTAACCCPPAGDWVPLPAAAGVAPPTPATAFDAAPPPLAAEEAPPPTPAAAFDRPAPPLAADDVPPAPPPADDVAPPPLATPTPPLSLRAAAAPPLSLRAPDAPPPSLRAPGPAALI